MQDKADRSVRKLKRKLIEDGGLVEEGWAFDVSYNHHEGVVSLYEVFRQRMNDQTSSFWRWLGSVEVAPDWFQSAMNTMAVNYDFEESVVDADLRKHVQRYESLLLEGNRILVVAHSQGNFYANSAYNILQRKGLPMDSFGIVSVATPASYVAGGGPYYTQSNDIIIYAVEQLFRNTLDPNVANIPNLDDWTNHGFVDSYLKGNASGPLIVNSVLSEAHALAWPEPELGSGPISITLKWGVQPDVDLHVYEPNWTHVYYANRVGSYGYLDRDDVDGEGPEHYYVSSCTDLEPGFYIVDLNYYRGYSPATAHVQIQAGETVRNYTELLMTSMGNEGNSLNSPIAYIEVLEEEQGGYSFVVNGL